MCGGLRDAHTGLVFLIHRDYAPDLGHFIQPDPLGYAGGDVEVYGYCLDDPINLVDPLGLAGERVEAPAAPDAAPVEPKIVNPNAPKEGAWKEFNLPGVGKTHLENEFGTAVQSWRDAAEKAGINLTFTEGFRTTFDQVERYNDKASYTPARPGTSLHEAGRAVDISISRLKDSGQFAKAVEIAKEQGIEWGGRFNDPVHFYKEVLGGRSNRGVWIHAAQGNSTQW